MKTPSIATLWRTDSLVVYKPRQTTRFQCFCGVFFTPRVYLKSATNRQSWHFHVSNINTWLTLYRVITAFVALRSLGRYRANLWMCLLYYYRYGYLPDGSWQFRPSSSGSNVLVGTERYFWVKTLRNMSYGVI